MRRWHVSVEDEEANAFALFLLMPNPHFANEMRVVKDLLDEDTLQIIAKKFRVSVPILLAREALESHMRKARGERSPA